MYAVVRIRGTPGTDRKILDTLEMLNLKKKYNCTLIPEESSYEGMLNRVQNFVTWGEIDKELLAKIIEKRARHKEGKDIEELLEENEMDSTEDLAEAILEEKSLKKFNLNPTIPLSPPSGGFKNKTKKIYPKGESGYRGKEIKKLLKKMV
ncbi:MAG: 50S ribosomal protein L30 [Candidatus Aenigmatarchaeota archaeon]